MTGSAMNPHFTTSARPAMKSLRGNVSSVSRSHSTPTGGWNAPTRFLPSAVLIPVLPPTAASTIASSVVGATWLRGVRVVQVPTTLLAMVDASIGGKTGVDTAFGKNLVGAFHPPVAVISDLDTLATLPELDRVNGLAEALKHGVICDEAYFDRVASTDIAHADWQPIVLRSVEIKTSVVAADEREHGLRKTLNLGHTIGHAVEQLMEYRVPHGACVAFGMLIEARIAIAMGLCDPSLEGRIRGALEHFGLPTEVPGILTPESIVDATVGDKKARAGTVEYALPARCGAMAGAERGYGTPVPRDVAITALLNA